MDSLLIKGGVPLQGDVTISGAKNAVLPILAATLLTGEPCVIRRVPNLSDVKFMGQILTWLGAQVRFEGDRVCVQAKKIKARRLRFDSKNARLDLHHGTTAGPIAYRHSFFAGGCIIGARPINLHLKGFRGIGRARDHRPRVRASQGKTPARLSDVPGRARRLDRAGHCQRNDGRHPGGRRDGH